MAQGPLDLNELSLFTAIIEQGSVSAASRATGVPKATVSRKLSQLEERLGVKLFHRGSQKPSATEAGATLYQHCREALRRLQEAARLASYVKDDLSGTLRVSAPLDFGRSVLWPVVEAFLKAHPSVSVELFLSDRVVDLLGEGFDLAIRIGDVLHQDLVMKPLGVARAFLVASPEYLAKAPPITHPKDLLSHSCIVFNALPFNYRWRFVSEENELEEVEVRGPFLVNSQTLIKESVLAGFGVTRLPRYLCEREIKEGRLKVLLPLWSLGDRTVYTAHLGQASPAKVKVFIEFLQKYAVF